MELLRTRLITFFDGVNHLVNEENGENIMYLDFNKALGMVPWTIFISNISYRFTKKWIHNWLSNCNSHTLDSAVPLGAWFPILFASLGPNPIHLKDHLFYM